MSFIRTSKPLLYVLASIALFACAQGSTKGPGSGGEGGNDNWGGPTSSSSSTSSGSMSSSGSSGVPTTYCDTNSLDCTACITCSRTVPNGLCVAQFDACGNSADCIDYNTCISACGDGDTVCLNDCDAAYPVGLQIFNDYASCVICDDCAILCDAATACM